MEEKICIGDDGSHQQSKEASRPEVSFEKPPMHRIHNKSNGVSSHAACEGLSIDLYNADWFDGLMMSERKALKASKETIKFVSSFVGIAEDLEGDEEMGGSDEEHESKDLWSR